MPRIAMIILALSSLCATIVVLDTATSATSVPVQSQVMELAKSSSAADTSSDQYQIFNNLRNYWNLAKSVYRVQRAAMAANSRNSGLANLAFEVANNFFGYQPDYTFTDSRNSLIPTNVDRIFDR